MTTTPSHLSEALSGASKNAQMALDALKSSEYLEIPVDEKQIWAMSALLHLDMTRLIVAIEECSEPLAKLLMMSDALSKLFEAYGWYTKHGSQSLLNIANRRKSGRSAAQTELRRIIKENQIEKVKYYQAYRNKLSYHYDREYLTYLNRIGDESANDFYLLLQSFLRFSEDWATLTRATIQAPKHFNTNISPT